MEHFTLLLSLLVIFLVLGIGAFIWQARRLRRNLIENILSDHLLNRKFFSTLIVEKWADYINNLSSKAQTKQIDLITNEQTSQAARLITDTNLHWAAEFIALGKLPKSNISPTPLGQILHAWYLLGIGKKNQARKILSHITKTPHNLHGLYLLTNAKLKTLEGELLEASNAAWQAVKIFKKHHWLYEEASGYYLMGEIYRLANHFDTSEIMLNSALKIWQKINCTTCQSETLCSLGLLCATQNRFAEAENYFTTALNNTSFDNVDKNLPLYIICHLALNDIMQQNPKRGLNRLAKHSPTSCTTDIQALYFITLARSEKALNHYRKAFHFAKQAAPLYLDLKDYASWCETQYLAAEICLQHQKYIQAEKILHDILSFSRQHSSDFAIAKVYTALGLIMAQNDNLSAAENFFYQALNIETSKDNFAEMAIDYMNLAEVFRLQGNPVQEKHCLEAVMQYADSNDSIFNQAKERLAASTIK